jgi:hypothetical protein
VAGAGRLRQIPYLAPELGLLGLSDEEAYRVSVGALLDGEDAPPDGDRDDGHEDPDLARKAPHSGDGKQVRDIPECHDDGQTEHVEAREQADREQRPEGVLHDAPRERRKEFARGS